ncbi:D-hexose-6-phosphate mutarotase [Corynebacterium nasicanis]|uniref:glucose-6-phosphate 1-epimerase n=1 Tax=Corynebacterium nasicanis TaxID=1448267 RepID=A0ABW1Q8T6_9CORY
MDDLLTAGRLCMSPAGAHLTSADTDLGELFYLSSTTGFPIRGGIPIIAPAFADLLPNQPRHGFARTSDWRVTTDGRGFSATLVNEGLHFDLAVQELSEGVRLSLSLSVRNESGSPRTVQLGFHPYFRVGHVEKVSVHGLEGVDAVDRVSAAASAQEGAVTVTGPYDRIFRASRTAVIDDPELGRRITVTAEGADSTVVWNPGAEAAASMADVGAGEWADFLCVEPALLGADLQGIELADGASRELAMTVTVEKL